MMQKQVANIQLYQDGKWITVATFEAKGTSHDTDGCLEYDTEYVIGINAEDLPSNRVGLRYPVNFDYSPEPHWPAFLLDILPSGAGRRVWARRLGITEDYNSDWTLLVNGAGNAPGNIRIREAVISQPDYTHPGFTKQEIVEKNADFIEYAEECGAVVAGATDVAGDAPKFLVVQDYLGHWHPDGAIKDEKIADSWLVKFPRGRDVKDYDVLRNEAPYYEVARWFGIRVGRPLDFIKDCLFIQRFDRVPGPTFIRHGLETLAAASGISDYGVRTNHLDMCRTICNHATYQVPELLEYLKREVLNSALRNTDNHARNTAFLKQANNLVELSPLYDFAPMFHDPQGIARSSIWGGGLELSPGIPDWMAVSRAVGELIGDIPAIQAFLSSLAAPVAKLPEVAKQSGVEENILEMIFRRCEAISAGLGKMVVEEVGHVRTNKKKRDRSEK